MLCRVHLRCTVSLPQESHRCSAASVLPSFMSSWSGVPVPSPAWGHRSVAGGERDAWVADSIPPMRELRVASGSWKYIEDLFEICLVSKSKWLGESNHEFPRAPILFCWSLIEDLIQKAHLERIESLPALPPKSACTAFSSRKPLPWIFGRKKNKTKKRCVFGKQVSEQKVPLIFSLRLEFSSIKQRTWKKHNNINSRFTCRRRLAKILLLWEVGLSACPT